MLLIHTCFFRYACKSCLRKSAWAERMIARRPSNWWHHIYLIYYIYLSMCVYIFIKEIVVTHAQLHICYPTKVYASELWCLTWFYFIFIQTDRSRKVLLRISNSSSHFVSFIIIECCMSPNQMLITISVRSCGSRVTLASRMEFHTDIRYKRLIRVWWSLLLQLWLYIQYHYILYPYRYPSAIIVSTHFHNS